MNLTGNTILDGYCMICGKSEYIPEELEDKWICEECKVKKQEEFQQEMELQNE